MNLSLLDINGGGLLVISQFTLAADTNKGLRPSFSSAAPPAAGREPVRPLFSSGSGSARHRLSSGVFGADMQVSTVQRWAGDL